MDTHVSTIEIAANRQLQGLSGHTPQTIRYHLKKLELMKEVTVVGRVFLIPVEIAKIHFAYDSTIKV